MSGKPSRVFDPLKNRICLLQQHSHQLELRRVDGDEADPPWSFSGAEGGALMGDSLGGSGSPRSMGPLKATIRAAEPPPPPPREMGNV